MNEAAALTPDADLSRAWTLPASWYTDASILPQERDKIFYRTWQWVGAASLVKRAGDYFTYDLYGEPLVISRGQDGILRAHSTTCACIVLARLRWAKAIANRCSAGTTAGCTLWTAGC